MSNLAFCYYYSVSGYITLFLPDLYDIIDDSPFNVFFPFIKRQIFVTE